MRMIVEVTRRDDKTTVYECIDAPYWFPPFVTLYLPDFERLTLHTDQIKDLRQRYEHP